MTTIWACNSDANNTTTTTTAPATGDLSGYTLVSLPNTTMQRATIVRADGSLQEQGYVQNGKKTGTWISYYVEKGIPKTVTSYADGNLDGLFIQFNERGQIQARTNYKLNQYDGLAMTYKFGRPVMESNYKDGQLEGLSRNYNENTGKLQSETEFKAGQQHGTHKVYNEEGQIIMEYVYKNGKKVSGGIVNETN